MDYDFVHLFTLLIGFIFFIDSTGYNWVGPWDKSKREINPKVLLLSLLLIGYVIINWFF